MSSLNGPWTTSVWINVPKDDPEHTWFVFHHSPPAAFSRRGRQIQRHNGQHHYSHWILQSEIERGMEMEPVAGVGVALESQRDRHTGEDHKYLIQPIHFPHFVEKMKRILAFLKEHPLRPGTQKQFLDNLLLYTWTSPLVERDGALCIVPPPIKKKRRYTRRRVTKRTKR